jgi:hypothetical protein
MAKNNDNQPQFDFGNRWAAPSMVVSGVLGLVWIVFYYAVINSTVAAKLPKWYLDLGNWNLGIGMALIMLAFVFAMKWK